MRRWLTTNGHSIRNVRNILYMFLECISISSDNIMRKQSVMVQYRFAGNGGNRSSWKCFQGRGLSHFHRSRSTEEVTNSDRWIFHSVSPNMFANCWKDRYQFIFNRGRFHNRRCPPCPPFRIARRQRFCRGLVTSAANHPFISFTSPVAYYRQLHSLTASCQPGREPLPDGLQILIPLVQKSLHRETPCTRHVQQWQYAEPNQWKNTLVW